MIVVWRACVVWTWDRRVTIPSSILVMTAVRLAIYLRFVFIVDSDVLLSLS